MRQQWYCMGCEVMASCVIPKGADVYTGVRRLDESHKRWSPKCAEDNGIGKIRVRRPGTSSQDWETVEAGGTSWTVKQRGGEYGHTFGRLRGRRSGKTMTLRPRL